MIINVLNLHPNTFTLGIVSNWVMSYTHFKFKLHCVASSRDNRDTDIQTNTQKPELGTRYFFVISLIANPLTFLPFR